MKNQRANDAAAAALSAVGFTCSFLPTMFFLVSFSVLAKPHKTLVIDIKQGIQASARPRTAALPKKNSLPTVVTQDTAT